MPGKVLAAVGAAFDKPSRVSELGEEMVYQSRPGNVKSRDELAVGPENPTNGPQPPTPSWRKSSAAVPRYTKW